MTELAAIYPDKSLSVGEVAHNQHLSPKYLEQIMSALKIAGLVRAVRGMHGGYALVRPPKEITLREVFEALEGATSPVDCVEHPEECPNENVCPTRETWVEITKAVTGVLENTTLQDLADRKKKKTDMTVGMYQI